MRGPLLLTAAGVAALFLPVYLKLADLPDAVPVATLMLGAAWGLWAWRRKRGKRRCAIASAQVLLALGLSWWMFFFSAYAEADGVPVVGDPAPEITAVRVRDGAAFHLAAQRGGAVLLVFFRGEW